MIRPQLCNVRGLPVVFTGHIAMGTGKHYDMYYEPHVPPNGHLMAYKNVGPGGDATGSPRRQRSVLCRASATSETFRLATRSLRSLDYKIFHVRTS